jgi:hypothetical protein
MWVPKTLMFAGRCEARSVLTLVSQRITRPFRLSMATIRFPNGTQNLVTIRLYQAEDDQAPTTGRPSGVSLLQDFGQVDYLRGDGVQVTVLHTIDVTPAGAYLKVHADNSDWYDHMVDVDLQILVEDESTE